MAKDMIVDEIRRLSQDEGLNDTEIGIKMGYARGSVQRIRKAAGIPTHNLNNRKDKSCFCMKCDKIFYIRRCESDKIVCPDCEKFLAVPQ